MMRVLPVAPEHAATIAERVRDGWHAIDADLSARIERVTVEAMHAPDLVGYNVVGYVGERAALWAGVLADGTPDDHDYAAGWR